jgi:hypothetical protein
MIGPMNEKPPRVRTASARRNKAGGSRTVDFVSIQELAARRAMEQQIRDNLARQFRFSYFAVFNRDFGFRVWLGLN